MGNFLRRLYITGNKIELVKEINWHENGQKLKEGTYKDGERDGLYTVWYKNGQKEYEGTWKAWQQRWDENEDDGSLEHLVFECHCVVCGGDVEI